MSISSSNDFCALTAIRAEWVEVNQKNKSSVPTSRRDTESKDDETF